MVTMTLTLDFLERMALLIAVQQLRRPDGTLRVAALDKIQDLTGMALPPETVSPPEAGSSVLAALRWLGLTPVEASNVL